MFKIGDNIDYGFYSKLTIIGKDEKHYILRNIHGNEKKIFISLVDKHGKLLANAKETFLKEYEELCMKHGMFINFLTGEPKLEPNPNKEGNETTKEWSWVAFLKDNIKKLKK